MTLGNSLPYALAATLLLASPAAAAPSDDRSAVCPDDPSGERAAVVEWINEVRSQAGLPALATDRRLCAVAQRRAEEMAAAESVETDARALQKVSRSLFGVGYEAHRWTERAILGYQEPVQMVRSWRAGADSSFESTSLGEFEDVGVGVASTDGDAVTVSLIFAVPRRTELTRVSEPLRDLERVRAQALERVNRARQAAKLRPLEENRRLNEAAQRYAERMLAERFYAHVAPDGSNPSNRVAEVDYGPVLFLAENIAQGLFEPGEVVERWLASPDHRRNIEHARAAEIGFGVAYGDTPDGFRVLWVQLFGRRQGG